MRWAGLGETFSEITDAAGNRQIVSRDQSPIAIKIVTSSLLEKFVRFQEPLYHASDKPLTIRLVTHFGFIKQKNPDSFVPEVLDSREYFETVAQRQRWFWWQPGRYEVTLTPSSPQRFRLVASSFAFELQTIDVDALRKNIALVDTEIRNIISSNLSGFKPEFISWQWANVGIHRSEDA
jgi:hypothetical protein